MNFMKKTAGPLFHSVTVFDVYQGENLDKRQKSVAFRLVLQDKKATLQESTLNELQTKLIESLKTQFSLSIR
jgi:phenylalanyl-tRNA synthetase beta chain